MNRTTEINLLNTDQSVGINRRQPRFSIRALFVMSALLMLLTTAGAQSAKNNNQEPKESRQRQELEILQRLRGNRLAAKNYSQTIQNEQNSLDRQTSSSGADSAAFASAAVDLSSVFADVDNGFNGNLSDGYTRVETIAVQTDGKIIVGGTFPIVNGIKRDYLTRLNEDGSIDSNFNADGAGPNGGVQIVQIQADGKILIGGFFSTYNGVSRNRIARLNADGSLDATFDAGTGFNSTVNDILLSSGGKIIVSGSFSQYNGATANRIVKLNDSGSLDTAFVAPSINSTVYEVASQSNGKLIIAGFFSSVGGSSRSGLARLNANGSFDASFDAGTNTSFPFAVAVQNDDKILVPSNTTSLIRLDASGALDASFTSAYVPYSSSIHEILVLPDGKILTGGAFGVTDNGGSGNDEFLTVVKFNADGSLDANFAAQKAVGGGSEVFAVAAAPNGKFVAGGDLYKFGAASSANKHIARLNADGAIDTSFSGSIEGLGTANAVVQQTDGKVIVGGTFEAANGTPHSNLARFNVDGSIDSSFNAALNFDVYSVALQPDGKILVGGRFSAVNGVASFGIARLNIDGSLDATFNITGIDNSYIYSVAVQPDGKILLGGLIYTPNGLTGIIRVGGDGGIDSSFAVAANSYYVYSIALAAGDQIYVGGSFSNYAGSGRNRIARLNANGAVDQSFNTGSGANSTVRTIAQQPDGKVLIGGFFTNVNGINASRIARLNANGGVDPTFNTGLGFTTGAGIYALVLYPNGQGGLQILAGGSFTTFNGASRVNLARLNADGSLQTAFNPSIGGLISALTVQTDGAVLVGGSFTSVDGHTHNSIARLNAPTSFYTISGQITAGGSALGGVSVALSGSANGAATTDSNGHYTFVNLTESGNYTVTPTLTNYSFTPTSSTFNNLISNQTANFAAATQTPTVTPTPSLSDQSHLESAYAAGVTEAYSSVRSTVIQPNDNKIIVGGVFSRINDAPRAYLERFLPDGTRDAAFNGGGSGPNGGLSEVVLDANGKILIGGGFSTYNGAAATRNIARLNSDGSLDSSFNGGTGANGGVEKIVVQSNGKILIGGYFTTYNNVARNRIARLNADGSLDATFDPGSGANDFVNEIAVQPNDGKIIIGGGFTAFNGAARGAYARLSADGSIDTSFIIGTGATERQSYKPVILGIAVQTNGKILLGGGFAFINGVEKNGLVRLNSDGNIDDSFTRPFGAYIQHIGIDASGKILIGGSIHDRLGVLRLNDNGSIDSSFQATRAEEDVVSYISLQADGKLIVGGPFTKWGDSADRRYLVRLEANGVLDASFNVRLSREGEVRNIVSQPDGKNIVTGNFLFANGTKRHNIARFNADGTLDASFAPARTESYEPIDAVAVQSDGKILIGGNINRYGGIEIKRLARLNADGSLDASFNNAMLPPLPQVGFAQVLSIKIQPDGKILVGGTAINEGGASRHFARLNADGSLDANFNVGTATTSISNTVRDIEITPDGKIIVSGPAGQYDGAPYNGVLRLNGDGTRDASFAVGTGANSTVRDAAIQTDGKIIVAGEFTAFNGSSRNRVARLNADGSLDAAFNVGTGANSTVSSVALQANGKILIGGSFSAYNGAPSLRLARLHDNGAFDASFESRLQTDANIQRVHRQNDGKMLFGGTFNFYAGIARSSLVRLTETPAAASVATPIGQSVVVSTPDAALNFSSIASAGTTVVTAMSPNQLQPLPPGYVLPAGTPMYDITTTAVFSGGITVSLKVPNVADATACSRLRLLHFTNNAWDTSNNLAPVYDSATGICTVSQNVTSLSPFVVAQTNAATYTLGGTVTYGNVSSGEPARAVSGVNLRAVGASDLSAVSDPSGAYQLANLAASGPYTVTPTKTGGVNGINSLDATRIQQYRVGLTTLTANQLIAADTDGNGIVNSLDATRIQQYQVGIQSAHNIGQWKFLPANRQYSSLAANLAGENYQAVLIGEVSGNWSNQNGYADSGAAEAAIEQPFSSGEASDFASNADQSTGLRASDRSAKKSDGNTPGENGIAFSIGDVAAPAETIVSVPLRVDNLSAAGVEALDFSVFYDPAIVAPAERIISTVGTMTQNCVVLAHSPSDGVIKVSVSCPNQSIAGGAGALIHLRLKTVGAAGRQTRFTFTDPQTGENSLQFNDGKQSARVSDGSLTIAGASSAGVTISGRATNAAGRGIVNAIITMTDAAGETRAARTTNSGSYRFENVAAGATYTISAQAKRFVFTEPTRVVSADADSVEVNFVARGNGA